MPLVRITLKKGKKNKFKKSISKAIHQALIKEFKIPADDLFQIIEEINQKNIIYPSKYMGIIHTNNIIYITIIAKRGRSKKMKKNLYKAIVKNIFKKTNHNKKDILITLIENSEENWSFGNGKAQLI